MEPKEINKEEYKEILRNELLALKKGFLDAFPGDLLKLKCSDLKRQGNLLNKLLTRFEINCKKLANEIAEEKHVLQESSKKRQRFSN